MSEKPIRVAVVGTGDFGRNHVRVWREIEGAELTGIVDSNAERAEKCSWGVWHTWSSAIPNRCRAEGVQAVSLAVPTKEHANIGCRLLEAGIDVLVEKPIAASLGEADQLIAAAKRRRTNIASGPCRALQCSRHRRAENRFASHVF